MIKEILKATGLQFRRSRFLKPPAEKYAVYMDDVDTDGPDGINQIFTHNITLEVYAPTMDEDLEAAIEAELNARGLQWEKQDWYWLQTEQRYQAVYEFSYIIKN